MDKGMYEEGLVVRREVLGAEHVDRSIANADDFTRPFQELVTACCWGAIWTRPGLSRKTRSIINLAMLAALNRPHEIKLHLRGAVNNGVSKEEVLEIFLQVAIYAGMPAGLDGIRLAHEFFAQEEAA